MASNSLLQYNNKRNTLIIGKVKDYEDPRKLGRIRVEIPGRTNGLKKEDLPWYYPCFESDSFSLPKLEEEVKILLIGDNIYFGIWERLERVKFKEGYPLSEEDYKSSKILTYHDLSDNEHEGILKIWYTKTDGFLIQLRDSLLNIREDHTIAFSKDGNTWIDINERRISIGTKYADIEEDKEWEKDDTSAGGNQQPVALGTDTAHACNLLLEEIHAYEEKMDEGLKKLSQIASNNPYTSPLAPAFTKLANDLKTTEKQWYDKIKSFLPEILSTVIIVDKK